MRLHLRALVLTALTALTVASSILASAGPAQADHTNALRHWGHFFRPMVVANCAQFGGQMCNYTSSSENFWNGSAYPNGFTAGQPYPAGFNACTQSVRPGWIGVCAVDAETSRNGILGLQGSEPGSLAFARTFIRIVANPNEHLDGARIEVCGNCGYSAAFLTAVITHEYGHAIGLGDRTSESGTIMFEARSIANETRILTAHDNAALSAMYDRAHEAELRSNQQLRSSHPALISSNGLYKARIQADGNFVVSNASNGAPIWSTQTGGAITSGNHLAWMYTDGRFLVYHATSGGVVGRCYTPTQNSNGAFLRIGGDSNLVIYVGSVPIWARTSGTCIRV